MFDHLDDPEPFATDEQVRLAVVRRGRARKRRAGVRNLAIESGAVLLLFVAAFGGYVRWQATRIDRVSIAAIPQVDAHGNVVAPNVGALDQPFTILVFGDDAAPDLAGDDVHRTDSIMLVRVNKTTGTVRVLSIPRDLLVTYDDGTQDRINVARQRGIPALITAINRTLGITIDHYAEARFEGFARFVDAIDGVPIEVDRPVRDDNTGLNLGTGCQVLDGEQALALARSRHLMAQDATGRFVEDPRSDLGRIARQQILGIAAARKAAQGSLAGSIGSLDALVGTDPSQITLDDHLGLHDLLDLSEWVGALPDDGAAIQTSMPSVHGAVTSTGASVLLLDDRAADDARMFLTGTPTPTTPTTATPPTTASPTGAPASAATWVEPIRVPSGVCR